MATAICTFVAAVLCISGVLAFDEYVDDIKDQCRAKSDFLSCGKYEAAKYITKTVMGQPTKVIDGILQFVTLRQVDTNETLFSTTRQMRGDSEYSKFFKFVQRQLNGFMGNRALAFSLPEQVKIVETAEPNNEIYLDRVESRGKKKKVAMLLPLITLFKVFKVKVLLALVLAGILFIKKAIALLFLLAPSYLQMLKICKVPHYSTHVEEHDYGSTGYGYPHASHGHHGSGYAKEWSNSRAYAAHKPT